MTPCRHIRRWSVGAIRGVWVLRCDCGWSGTATAHDDDRPRSRQEIDGELEAAFLAHLGPGERRTYLLLDTRPPPAADAASGAAIIGNFVMPEGVPVLLISERQEGGVHYGTYRLGNDAPAELPIGEVRTPEGRVFRLDE